MWKDLTYPYGQLRQQRAVIHVNIVERWCNGQYLHIKPSDQVWQEMMKPIPQAMVILGRDYH